MTVNTIFVTGAEGFLGTHLSRHLRERGYEVVAGVRNRARKLAYERHFGKALVCDVSDAINVARVIAGVRPDGIVHLAGTSHAHEASAEPLTAYQSIVTAWANVLDGVRRARLRTRVVMASTCEVYGNAGGDGHALHEDTPLEPLSTFASLKVAAESIAHTFYRDYHLDVTIARPFHYARICPAGETYCTFGTWRRRTSGCCRRASRTRRTTSAAGRPAPSAKSCR